MLGVITELEIMELTGRKRRDKQIEELHSMGVRFLVRSDGSLVIARAHVESLLGVVAKPIKEPQLHLER